MDIQKLNSSYVNSIVNYLRDSAIGYDSGIIVGSIQLPKDYKSVIEHPDRVVRYICKYFTKTIGARYSARNYFISRELRGLIKPIELTVEQQHLLSNSFGTVFDKKFKHVRVIGYDKKTFDIINQLNTFEHEKTEKMPINRDF